LKPAPGVGGGSYVVSIRAWAAGLSALPDDAEVHRDGRDVMEESGRTLSDVVEGIAARADLDA
jgi:hypothetical protein